MEWRSLKIHERKHEREAPENAFFFFSISALGCRELGDPFLGSREMGAPRPFCSLILMLFTFGVEFWAFCNISVNCKKGNYF